MTRSQHYTPTSAFTSPYHTLHLPGVNRLKGLKLKGLKLKGLNGQQIKTVKGLNGQQIKTLKGLNGQQIEKLKGLKEVKWDLLPPHFRLS